MIHQSGFNPPARLRSADHTQRSMPALGVGWCATPSYLARSLAHIGRALTSCFTQRSRGASSNAWRRERALQLSSCLPQRMQRRRCPLAGLRTNSCWSFAPAARFSCYAIGIAPLSGCRGSDNRWGLTTSLTFPSGVTSASKKVTCSSS